MTDYIQRVVEPPIYNRRVASYADLLDCIWYALRIWLDQKNGGSKATLATQVMSALSRITFKQQQVMIMAIFVTYKETKQKPQTKSAEELGNLIA